MLKALWSGRFRKEAPVGHPSEILDIAGLTVIWRKSVRRTRSLALKVDKQGQIVVMTPVATPLTETERFIRSREAWIRQHLLQYQELEAKKSAARGHSIWYLGEQHSVINCRGAKNLIELEPGLIRVMTRQALNKTRLETRLTKWLRTQAEVELTQCLAALSKQTGMHGSGLQIKSYNARWGSCRHDGLIQLNWKLIKTPPAVANYVIIHELSHLNHFNHSPAFWEHVERHCPDYKHQRKWLKENGRLLIAN